MFNYLCTNIKIVFRIPLSVFFSIVYPLLMMIIMMLSYGNMAIGAGYYLIDKYFLVTIGMGILPLTLISFPIWLASSIEDDSLKRMQYFRVKFIDIITADILAHFLIAILSMFLNIILAFFAFHLKIPGILTLFSFIAHYILVLIVFMLLGGLLALLFKKTQILMPLGLVLMFMLYMFCGAFISYEELPPFIKDIATFIPMKYAMNDFFNIWNSTRLLNTQFLCLSGVYIAVLLMGILITYRKGFKR